MPARILLSLAFLGFAAQGLVPADVPEETAVVSLASDGPVGDIWWP
ncbi:hypothetical protein ACPCKV_27750 [Streptomyces koyangensis]